MRKFEYSEQGAQDENGNPTPAYGFTHEGTFIYDPYLSECGRFKCSPTVVYGLSLEDADRLVHCNRQLGLEMSS